MKQLDFYSERLLRELTSSHFLTSPLEREQMGQGRGRGRGRGKPS